MKMFDSFPLTWIMIAQSHPSPQHSFGLISSPINLAIFFWHSDVCIIIDFQTTSL